jgi:hypothetical protein
MDYTAKEYSRLIGMAGFSEARSKAVEARLR